MQLRIISVLLGSSFFPFFLVAGGIENGISPAAISLINPDSLHQIKWIRTDSVSLNLLPPSSGIRFYRDGLLFLSSSKFEEKMIPDHISFGKTDTRYAPVNDYAGLSVKVFSPSQPFTYPCEGVTFSKDFNTMYFTRFARDKKTEMIYHARFESGDGKDGSWILDTDPLSFCNTRSIYTHPALSADGDFMVFASDRPGSYGGLDLYVSTLKNGKWSEPVNLGDAVNSAFNESYPFLDSENNLYFSSDNAQGYGGYDIYVCKFKGNTWEKPINLSDPVNTKFDDIAFAIDNNEGKTAYYTIRQNSGRKALQLIRISFNRERPDTLLTLSQFFTRPDISQMVILAIEPAVQATDSETDATSIKATGKTDGINGVKYKVQFMTSFNPGTRSTITLRGTDYGVSEYLYSGAYRLCVGEFDTRSEAVALQNILKSNNYPRAAIVIIKNNEFSPDEDQGNQSSAVRPVHDSIILPAQKSDTVLYRVQILTSNKSKGNYKILLDNKSYDTFEYFYAGAYRICIGYFRTVAPALDLLRSCRKAGFSQSFVVAFKNNVRCTDPALFK